MTASKQNLWGYQHIFRFITAGSTNKLISPSWKSSAKYSKKNTRLWPSVRDEPSCILPREIQRRETQTTASDWCRTAAAPVFKAGARSRRSSHFAPPTITQLSLEEQTKMAAGSHNAQSSCWFGYGAIPTPPPPFPAATEVKLSNNHLSTVPAYSSQMAPRRNNSRWQVLGGWRDAAGPVWLGKQSWGLICPTPPQKRGCNSIGSWPTVLPWAGSAAQALLKKGPAEEMSQRAPCRAKGATPRVLVLFFLFFSSSS